MGIRLSYGGRSRIDEAIQAQVIPKDSIIFTNDNSKDGEIFFYDKDGKMSTFQTRSRFESLAEAEEWIKKYDCTGKILSIYDGVQWLPFIVEANSTLSHFPATAPSQPLITQVSEEFVVAEGTLSIQEITMDKVKGLSDALKEAVGVTGTAKSIKINGEELQPDEEGCIDIPSMLLTGIQTTSKENGITVNEDNSLEVNEINMNKLVQTDGDVLIFDAGNIL